MALKNNIRIILKGIVFGSVVFINSQLSKDVVAQITEPVDSIWIEFGRISQGYDRRAITEPTWELKNGVPQVRDTIDFGKIFLSKNEDDFNNDVPGNGFGVDGTGRKFDTVLVKGEIYSWPEDEPFSDVGVAIFGYVNNGFDSYFLGENYLEPRAIYADEQGKWYMPILMPTKKDNITITGIKTESIDDKIPNNFELYQNYPNPFNPSTTIKYTIPKQNKVTLKVFDVLGSELATLINKEQPQGNYEVEFDGKDLTSGIYFYRLQAGDFIETKKMILLK